MSQKFPNDYLDDDDTLPAEPIQLPEVINLRSFILGALFTSIFFYIMIQLVFEYGAK